MKKVRELSSCPISPSSAPNISRLLISFQLRFRDIKFETKFSDHYYTMLFCAARAPAPFVQTHILLPIIGCPHLL